MKKVIFVAAMVAAAGAANAQISTVVDNNSASLAAALTAGGTTGITINSLSISSANAAQVGRWAAPFASNNYGLGGQGIIISSGDVSNYGTGPNTATNFTGNFSSPAPAADIPLLEAISGSASYFDSARIDIVFTPDAGITTVGFDVVFGSDEFFEFVGSTFIDAFGLFVNGTNIAFANGSPINVNHPDGAAIVETELDGVIAPFGNPVMIFSATVTPEVPNTLTFIIADRGDAAYDSTAYIKNFGVPTPGALALLGLGGLVVGRRRR